MSVTVRELWERRVDASAEDPFLVLGDRRWSYGEFDASVNRLANALREDGVSPGDTVALLLPSDLLLLRAELALQKLGAVMVPMIDTLTLPEVSYVLGHSRAGRLITDARGLELIAPGGEARLPTQPRVSVADGERLPIEADDAAPPPAHGRDPLQPMAIMYTSGSTGRPKGVVQPGAGFATAGEAIASRLGAGPADNFLSTLPLFHTAATHMLLAPAIAVGARFTLVPRFSRERFWRQVRDAAATISLLMPAQLSILMTATPDERDREHPLRLVFSHIHPLAFCERFGVEICTTWAMTEISGMGTMTARGHSDYPPKLIGPALPAGAELKVVDPESGRRLAPGELGELCYRHPHAMLEYFDDPANTAATLRDGWVHSGDLGALDQDGNAYFHGRLKNVIKRAGENIAGEEVEFTVMEHPAVEECVVVGVEDPIYTEEVHATAVVRAGARLTEAEVADWCAERLAGWKVPRYVALRHEPFPRLANGKTDRRAVRATADPATAWDRLRQAPAEPPAGKVAP